MGGYWPSFLDRQLGSAAKATYPPPKVPLYVLYSETVVENCNVNYKQHIASGTKTSKLKAQEILLSAKALYLKMQKNAAGIDKIIQYGCEIVVELTSITIYDTNI